MTKRGQGRQDSVYRSYQDIPLNERPISVGVVMEELNELRRRGQLAIHATVVGLRHPIVLDVVELNAWLGTSSRLVVEARLGPAAMFDGAALALAAREALASPEAAAHLEALGRAIVAGVLDSHLAETTVGGDHAED